jgi:hypothetical protein
VQVARGAEYPFDRGMIPNSLHAFSHNGKEETMFKPQGHHSLSPYLIVDDAQATLDFIKAVFDAEPVHCGEMGNGRCFSDSESEKQTFVIGTGV